MNQSNDRPEPEETRETRTPPPAAPPTRHVPTPPADGPTQFIHVSPPPLPPPSRRRAQSPPQRPLPAGPRYRPPLSPPPIRHVPTQPPTPTPPPPAGGVDGELPWWQTINRDRPKKAPNPPPRSAPPQPPPVKRAARPAGAPVVAPDQPAPAVSGRSRSTWWRVAAAGLAMIIAVVALALSLSGNRPAPRVLDIATVQEQVEQILRDPLDGYGVGSVTGVVCNNGINPAVEKNTGFTCEVVIDGVAKHVAVVFQDDDGTYAVDRPR
jgi:hypothetical protein